MIAALKRPHLRPAAIGKLRGQKIADAAKKAGPVSLAIRTRRCARDQSKKMQFRIGGVVIERADVVPVRVFRSVEVVHAGML